MPTDDLLSFKDLCSHVAPARWPNGQLYCNACRRDLTRLPGGSLRSIPAVADSAIYSGRSRWSERRVVAIGRTATRRAADAPDIFNASFNGPNPGPAWGESGPEPDTFDYIEHNR